MIERHGEAIEYDLHHELHIDIHDYVNGDRDWAEFYRLIERLPRHGQFHASLLDNEQDAEELLARGEATTFGMRDWTYDRELLTLLVDEIRSLHATLIAVNSRGRSPKFSPLPRPVTAVDRVQRRQRLQRHHTLVALVRPVEPFPPAPPQPDEDSAATP